MEWWYIPLGVASLAVSIIAVKFAVTFDINRWMENKRNRDEEKLQNLCPHVYIDLQPDGNILIESHFYSPRGTIQYFCRQCGKMTYGETIPLYVMRIWSDPANWDSYIKREKDFKKLARKMGKI